MRRILALGECMAELAPGVGDSVHLGFGGDVYNTAVYLRRTAPADVQVAFVTAIGVDTLSDRMERCWRDEGIDTSLVFRVAGALPGLYMIEIDASGERRFLYWRQASAARQTLRALKRAGGARHLGEVDLLFFSGASLAILEPDSREILWETVGELRSNGTRIVFDPNYRPLLWNDRDAAREHTERAYAVADIVLPGLDDEAELFSRTTAEQVAEHLAGLGINEFIIKNGDKGILGVAGERRFEMACAPAPRVVDTTAAGDAFNGAYLGARLGGAGAEQAAASAARVAAHVIAHRGAIVPRDQFRPG